MTDSKSLADSVGIKWINRNYIKNGDSLGLDELMMHSLKMIEDQEDFPEGVMYVNHDYLNRPKGIFDELVSDAFYNGFDVVFPGLIDYGHYWYRNQKNEFEQTDPSLKIRINRDPLYKALYGLGCFSSSWLIRSGKFVGGKIGILKINDSKYSVRKK